MKIDDLKQYVKPLVFFGEMQIEISEEKDGFKICILDHEEGQILDVNGKVVDPNYSSTLRRATLYTDESGEVNFIEHGMGAFTRANKEHVILLANLIGQTIEVSELLERKGV